MSCATVEVQADGERACAQRGPQIHAVVDVLESEGGDWIQLPSKPWPHYVRLWRDTAMEEVALVVGMLSSYGRDEVASAETLADDFPSRLPGGFAVVEQDTIIGPSCCCGLETWREWQQVLVTGGSPWMGHDPSPLVEVVADRVNVWADGGLGDPRPIEGPVVFSRDDFKQAIDTAARDLAEFEEPLRKWLSVHASGCSEKILGQFRETFILGREHGPAPTTA